MSKCNQVMEVYSRVCGYFRPTKCWNKGKAEEFKQRKVYSVSGAMRTVKRQDDIMQARTA